MVSTYRRPNLLTLALTLSFFLIGCTSGKRLASSNTGATGNTGTIGGGNGGGSTFNPGGTNNNTNNSNNNNNGGGTYNPGNYGGGNPYQYSGAPVGNNLGPTDQVPVYQNQGGTTTVSTMVALSAWRCEAMGDSIGQTILPGLGITEYEGRMQWGERCLPQYRDWYFLARQAKRADGSVLPLYPTYGFVNAQGVASSVRTPILPSADCNAGLPPGMVLLAFCTPGCYAPDQEIYASTAFGGDLRSLSEAQPMSIKKAMESKSSHIVTLAPGSSLDKIQLHSSETSYMSDFAVADLKPQAFITLSMKSGKSLVVTPEHPLVDGKGIMRAARHFAAGDSLLAADGSADPVVKVVREDKRELAFNVSIKSHDPMQGLVIGGGYVNGDLKYQRHEFEWMNRLLERANVPNEVVE